MLCVRNPLKIKALPATILKQKTYSGPVADEGALIKDDYADFRGLKSQSGCILAALWCSSGDGSAQPRS